MTFVPSREGPFYQGTSLTLPCTVILDRSLVDTDVNVDFTFSNVSSTRVTTDDVVQLNDSTYISMAQFSILLPDDNGNSYICTTLFRPVPYTPFIEESDDISVIYSLGVEGKT